MSTSRRAPAKRSLPAAKAPAARLAVEAARPAAGPVPADVVEARRVIALEAEALGALAAALDDAFVAAVDMLMAVEGRVIVSGMGKSGHVGGKIAATFASTGTPAQFVHPAEASHGDLGMITARDAVLMLSNSGETRELADLIAHTRRHRIPLIGMASRKRSTLLTQADVALLLPKAPEACPMGLAPTTSTTMMLALGDALAVALMKRRGFGAEDYRVLHPGGALGQALRKVEAVMHAGDELPLVRPDAPMREVLLVMTSRRFGCAGVVDESGGLLGIVTDGDLRRHLNRDLLDRTAADVMTLRPRVVRAGALAHEALGLMTATKPNVTCLFVVADADARRERPRPVGIVHIHDVLRAGAR